MVLRFSYNFFESDSKDLFIKYMKNFIIYFSLITVYIYFAQIFDLFEFEEQDKIQIYLENLLNQLLVISTT